MSKYLKQINYLYKRRRYLIYYFCNVCGSKYSLDEIVWNCSCGNYLSLITEGALKKDDIINERYSLWRYEKALPVKLESSTVTLYEGFTPLAKVNWKGIQTYFKLDYLMPSGSFKDRGTTVMINFLKKLGIKKIVEDSSGNAGASIAAYSAASNIECEIFVPESTSAGKLVQIRLYGAKVNLVPGNRDKVAIAAIAKSNIKEDVFYASHNWHPMFIEGTKTLAFEIWEQLGWDIPDNIVAPLGGGSSILGLYKGFEELLQAGEISHIPKLFGIQAQNCSPLYSMFQGNTKEFKASPTIAEGIALEKPIKANAIIEKIKASGGEVEIVTETEIADALTQAALIGYYIEPTTAAALAGVNRLLSFGKISNEEATVTILTGCGLKASDKISRIPGVFKDE